MERIDPRRLLVKIVDVLNRLDIPYFITGGIAVLIWGRPRFTADIDIIIQLESAKAKDLERTLKSLSQTGYVDKDAISEALLRQGEFNFIDGETGIKVDFWIFRKRDPFSQAEFRRKIVKDVLGKKIYFVSPEDLILSKLLWYKKSQSTRHLEDVESVLKISKVDKKYLKNWAGKLDVAEIWARIQKK